MASPVAKAFAMEKLMEVGEILVTVGTMLVAPMPTVTHVGEDVANNAQVVAE